MSHRETGWKLCFQSLEDRKVGLEGRPTEGQLDFPQDTLEAPASALFLSIVVSTT